VIPVTPVTPVIDLLHDMAIAEDRSLQVDVMSQIRSPLVGNRLAGRRHSLTPHGEEALSPIVDADSRLLATTSGTEIETYVNEIGICSATETPENVTSEIQEIYGIPVMVILHSFDESLIEMGGEVESEISPMLAMLRRFHGEGFAGPGRQ
jgi:hypothetical protein